MNKDLKNKINQSPLKKRYIATQIGINPSVLSMCIKGDRFLSPDKEEKLKSLLNKAC